MAANLRLITYSGVANRGVCDYLAANFHLAHGEPSPLHGELIEPNVTITVVVNQIHTVTPDP